MKPSLPSFDYGGYKVFSTHLLAKYEYVERTWKERLFTRPWQPLCKYKQVELDNNEVIQDTKNRVMYVSPRTFKILLQRCGRCLD